MKNKKGFTLIELLAVIIILGILMIIAIPSVTQYINNSRKSAYVDTAREIIAGARNLVNQGNLEMFDTQATYYIPASCIGTENGQKSPYGDFEKAYVLVTYDGKGYKYYWISVDETGQGVDEPTLLEDLDEDSIVSDIDSKSIKTTVTEDNTDYVLVLQEDHCNTFENGDPVAADTINSVTTLVDVAGAKRYVGNVSDNYVWFNEELWRIIGVYNRHLKIIKDSPSTSSINYDINYVFDTENSTLIVDYLNDTYYSSLSSLAKKMIYENAEWLIGDCRYEITAEQAYSCANDKKVNLKVGLLAPYEYLYASPSSCWTTSGYSYEGSCANQNWTWRVLNGKGTSHAWLMSSYSIYDTNGIDVNRVSGRLESIGAHINYFAASPVVYLKSSVEIIGGLGTESSPYQLNM